jgi:2-polyprenyl-3-methyl-5-hydroxy-6-metoxy-1,4-benzoquinol methylase
MGARIVREDRFFPEGTVPDYCTPEWYLDREMAPHVDQDMHRPRLECAARFARSVWQPGMTIVDLGSGDGGLLTLLPDVPGEAKWGYDLQPTNVAHGTTYRGVDVRYGNVLTDDIDWGDIAIATEMIEHLVDPHGFCRLVAEHCRYIVASSPWIESHANHYEFHAWAWDVEGYAAMLNANGWRVIAHDTPGNFQVALAERV